MRFRASSGAERATVGQVLDLDGPVAIRVDVHAPDDATIRLLRGGVEVARAAAPTLLHEAPAEAATYRAEVELPGAPGRPPVPWMVSNPIYAGLLGEDEPPEATSASDVRAIFDEGPASGWDVETSERSLAALDLVPAEEGEQLLFRYGLGGTSSESPFAAVAIPAGELAMFDRLQFVARASRPMRLSVQLRTGGEIQQRWSRSVFVDTSAGEIDVWFQDFLPQRGVDRARPPLDEIETVLLVVDTLNAEPGTSGRVWIDRVRYAR